MRRGRQTTGGLRAVSLVAAWAGVVTALFVGSPAHAQEADEAQAQVRALIQERMSIYKRQDMEFGQIVISGTPGTVVLSPAASGTCTASGNLVRSGPCKAAIFSGYANPLSFVRVRRPPGNSLTLVGPGGATMQVDDFTYSSDSTMWQIGSDATYVRFFVIDGNGLYELRVGGTLNVGANQEPGVYTGTIEVLLNYN